MTQAGPLHWTGGAGWLILVGGRGPSGAAEIDDRLLARADLSRPIALVPAVGGSPSSAQALLDDYADLGGPCGYVVPILGAADAQDEENRSLLAEAGMVFLADGDAVALTRALRESPALVGVAEAFASGALVVGVGAGAAPMGEWVVTAEAPEDERGWGWVSGAAVIPHFSGSAREPHLQAALRTRPGLVGIGIPDGVALALGPDGQVETWGEGEVTVVVARQEEE